jgi:hypothetical protein
MTASEELGISVADRPAVYGDIACTHSYGTQEHNHENLLVPDPWAGFENTEPRTFNWKPRPQSVAAHNPL